MPLASFRGVVLFGFPPFFGVHQPLSLPISERLLRWVLTSESDDRLRPLRPLLDQHVGLEELWLRIASITRHRNEQWLVGVLVVDGVPQGIQEALDTKQRTAWIIYIQTCSQIGARRGKAFAPQPNALLTVVHIEVAVALKAVWRVEVSSHVMATYMEPHLKPRGQKGHFNQESKSKPPGKLGEQITSKFRSKLVRHMRKMYLAPQQY